MIVFWRRERDSNPRARERKLISSQPRYDHFDISPYMLSSVWSKTNYSIFHRTGRPVMSCSSIQIHSLICFYQSNILYYITVLEIIQGFFENILIITVILLLTFKTAGCIIHMISKGVEQWNLKDTYVPMYLRSGCREE